MPFACVSCPFSISPGPIAVALVIRELPASSKPDRAKSQSFGAKVGGLDVFDASLRRKRRLDRSANAGARLIRDPDWQTVTWTETERKNGEAWGLKTIDSFHTRGTPVVDETQG